MAAAKKQPAKTASKALLVLPKFQAKALKSYDVEANFDEMEAYLNQETEKYKDVAFSPSDMPQVEAVKKEMRDLRTSLEKIQKDVKTERYNAPKTRFDAKMEKLLGIAAKVEEMVDKVLSAADQVRIDELNEAFDDYCKKFQKDTGLRPEFEAKIERKKSFYNKTAVESASKADLKAQYEYQKGKQDAYDADVALVDKYIDGYPEINRETAISKLDNDMPVSQVVAWVESERERIDLVRAGGPEKTEEQPEQDAAGAKVLKIGVSAGGVGAAMKAAINVVAFKSDFPGKTVTRTMHITYPVDVGDGLTDLFKELKQFGVKVKVVKDE